MINFNNTLQEVKDIAGYQLYHYAELESTATTCKDCFFQNQNKRIVIVADKQTFGRGRLNNTWHGMDGNLFTNIVLPASSLENKSMAEWSQVSFIMAMVLSDVISDIVDSSKMIQVKWPNDILVDGAKIAGVLMEATPNGLSIGIGVNIVKSPQIKNYNTKSLLGCGVEIDKMEILEKFLERLNKWLRTWYTHGLSTVLPLWKIRAKGIETNITVRLPNKNISGLFIDIDDTGAIILETQSGKQTISSGEVVFG